MTKQTIWKTGFATLLLTTPYVTAQSNNGVQINTDAFGDNIVGDAANEPSFAISPVDPDVLVTGWRQFDTISSDVRYAGFAYSWDGGKTWTNGGILEPPPGSGTNAIQSDPVLATDTFGNFFYNSLIFRSQKDGLVVYGSDSGGADWSTPAYVRVGSVDKNWYTIDRTDSIGQNHHYSIWQYPGEFIRSTQGGMQWESPINIGASTMAYLEVGPDGEVYAGWWDNLFGGVVIKRSLNARDAQQTPTFGNKRKIPFGRLPSGLPVNPGGAAGQIYIWANQTDGPNRSHVYVAASSNPGGSDPADVMFSRSTDWGSTWSDPVRINDDVDPQGNDYQWMAAVSMAPGGRLDAVWFDTRDDPAHFLSRLYYSYSYDEGVTWAPNRPLSDQFDSTVGWPVQQKIGDYFQCLSNNAGTNIVYPATFNGEQDLYFLRTHPIALEVDPLIAGQSATFEITGAKPNETAWLAYSTTGEGRTFVPGLNVTVELDTPIQAGPPQTTNSLGSATWVLNIPAPASGMEVWIQALQVENASNIDHQTIQ